MMPRRRLRPRSRSTGANEHRDGFADPVAAEEAIVLPDIVARTMPAYIRARPRAASALEQHEVPTPTLVPLVIEIVAVEGPIHIDEVAWRIAAAFGKKSAGSRVLSVTRKALVAARRANADLRCEDDFWFNGAQAADPPVRDRSAERGGTCKADALSLPEIRCALRLAGEDNPGGSSDDLVRSAARLMGFRRAGPDLQARIREGLA